MTNQGAQKRQQDKIIDENLKRVYDATVEEGVPDRFRDLLDALKKQDGEVKNK